MEVQDIIQKLQEGSVGILPSDTIYGLMCKALDKKAVERIYKIKGRSPGKPCIILISSLDDLKLFNIDLDHQPQTINFLNNIWPNSVSVILPCPEKELEYLHRGTKTLAFRIPKDNQLLKIIKEAGPLLAPSANPESFSVARNINQAKEYFKDTVDFYLDAGTLSSDPSTLIKISKDKVEVLRQGKYVLYSLKLNQ